MKPFQKLNIALKYSLQGMNFIRAMKAYQMWKDYHTGVRKDWTTPEFQHQIEIALFIMTLKDVKNLEDVLIVTMLHDIREDYWVPDSEIRKIFWNEIAESVEKLTKKFRWSEKDKDYYFTELSTDPVASIVKWADRINNVNSMIWVFSEEKQRSYADEVKKYFLPMLKKARENFPEQSYAYQNMETYLGNLVRFVK
jgi:(p)ppGpp synthase/HD superfamily hydrolase